MDQQILSDEFLMADDELKKIGIFQFTLIFSEYMELISKGFLSTEYSDTCCKIHMIYGLPCRYLLLERLKKNQNHLLSVGDASRHL